MTGFEEVTRKLRNPREHEEVEKKLVNTREKLAEQQKAAQDLLEKYREMTAVQMPELVERKLQ